MTSQADYKLVLLGNPSSGKTCLFNRHVYNDFSKTSITIGAYYSLKFYGDKSVALWDTAGEEKFGSLTSFYCRHAHCSIVCFDLTNAHSFADLDKWVAKLINEGMHDCVIAIVGTKLDLVQSNPSLRKVESQDAQRYADSISAFYAEVSSKTGAGVSNIFHRVVEAVIQQHRAGPVNNNENKIDLDGKQDDKKPSSGGCC